MLGESKVDPKFQRGTPSLLDDIGQWNDKTAYMTVQVRLNSGTCAFSLLHNVYT